MNDALHIVDADENEDLRCLSETLLRGLPGWELGLLSEAVTHEDHARAWHSWLDDALPKIAQAMSETYQRVAAFEPDRLAAIDLTLTNELRQLSASYGEAAQLARVILESTSGARAQPIVDRLLSGPVSTVTQPAVAFAVKAAMFNSGIACAVMTYAYYEWRASGRAVLRLPDAFESFLAHPAHQRIPQTAFSGPGEASSHLRIVNHA